MKGERASIINTASGHWLGSTHTNHERENFTHIHWQLYISFTWNVLLQLEKDGRLENLAKLSISEGVCLTWKEQMVWKPGHGCHQGTRTGSWPHLLQHAEVAHSFLKLRPKPERYIDAKGTAAHRSSVNKFSLVNFLSQDALDLTMKRLPCTIIAVSIGEADTRRDPLGDQAMEVTGEWPGWDKTWAQPDEGLDGCRGRRAEHKKSFRISAVFTKFNLRPFYCIKSNNFTEKQQRQ